MAFETDLLIDRRRLKRRLALWRGAAVLLLAAAAAVLFWGRGEEGLLPGRGHVARVEVEGFISDDRRMIEALDRVRRDAAARAVILAIDSPGGSVAGGEALHAAIARLQARKPVVAVMRGTAASAGYMVALPAERIFAREATVTGSIGVLLQSPDVSDLMAQLGVRVHVIASGPFKDQPSPFRPLTDEGREELNRVVVDLHEQFVAKVAAGRRMDPAAVRPLADGRIFTGRQALAAGLVDAIGGEAEARAWLAAERQVPETLPVRDVRVRTTTDRLLGAALGSLAKTVISEWLGVDGPRLLWQAPR
ncbi:signal peptide peptidase SppA [Crenalkalicoccus roseus]|uniref:signal peptide peptidase SppA n=1 Tax=Crenalkalicoccus roseus TaxID=1485588 RepID=UPI0010800805|nr:signal peptide peptidase SppA [Crenalkalicoccus roseus]